MVDPIKDAISATEVLRKKVLSDIDMFLTTGANQIQAMFPDLPLPTPASAGFPSLTDLAKTVESMLPNLSQFPPQPPQLPLLPLPSIGAPGEEAPKELPSSSESVAESAKIPSRTEEAPQVTAEVIPAAIVEVETLPARVSEVETEARAKVKAPEAEASVPRRLWIPRA